MHCVQEDCTEPFCVHGCIRDHARMVRHLVYHITRNVDDMEDVTQDVFLKAYLATDTFRGGSFRAFLARITRNHCYDILRQRKARQNMISIEYVDEAWESDAPGPEAVLLDHELHREIGLLLQQLKEVDREIMLLRHVHQFSYDEIADAVGMRAGAVRTRIVRARQKLIELVEGREIDGTSDLG